VNSPTAVSLTGSGAASGSHSVTLSWTPSASAYVGFDVFRGTVSGGPYTQINTAMVPTPTYTDTTVAAGQTYYYVATQLNSSGVQSGYSNETVAVIP
jgi:fibronectin type 3 domain-containing protein